MATPHLCSTPTGLAGSQAGLLADGDHLLVIKHPNWWTDKYLLVTPDEECFAQSVAWGTESASDAAADLNGQNSFHLQSRLATARDAMTTESWHEGHKPLYNYWARSCPPYRICKDENLDATKNERIMECGMSWVALRFNFRALPTGSATGVYNIRAWWRVWNPSCLLDKLGTTAFGDTSAQLHEVTGYKSLSNDAGVIQFHISDELRPPGFHKSAGCLTLNVPAIANNGLGNGTSADSRALSYDIYNGHADAVSPSAYHGLEHVSICAKGVANGSPDRTPFYVDVPMGQSNAYAPAILRSALAERKPIWAHFGFKTLSTAAGDYSSNKPMAAMPKASTLFVYCSRIELLICTIWAPFNYG